MGESRRYAITLTEIACGGDCIARIDNRITFVRGGLPGEKVVVELCERRQDYQRGEVVEVVERASSRVAPHCPLFRQCGGCSWQHMDYSVQTEIKQRIVADQLRRIGGFGDEVAVNPTLSAANPWNYRNHVQFSVLNGRLGFVAEASHRFLEVAECCIAHPAINRTLASLQGKVQQPLTGHRSRCDGRQTRRARNKSRSPKIDAALPQIAVRCDHNMGRPLVNPMVEADEAIPFAGPKYLEEEILGRKFRVSATSFFQVNTPQAERMVGYTIDRLNLTENDTLLDVYCGVGTFGLLAAERARRVIGVEESMAALRDARHNAMGIKNVELIRGKAEEVLPGVRERVDAAIIDPPRAGCRKDVIEALRRLKPDTIVYVSCDPATLARDLRLLCGDNRYAIVDVQPIDMFPQTYHIETVVTLRSLE